MKPNALDPLLRDLGGLFQVRRLYPEGNLQVRRAAVKAAESLARWGRPLRIALLGEDTIVEDQSLGRLPPYLQPLFHELRKSGCESVHIEPIAGPDQLTAWVGHVGAGEPGAYESEDIVAGALDLEQRRRTRNPARLAQAAAGYLALLPRTEEALSGIALQRPEGLVQAREIVRALAAHLASGEDLLQPIRQLKGHDDYTFTHALNVCMLSTALARAVGAPEGLLDVLGLAALCHDLGKQRIPDEILNKQGKLEPEERRIMDDHVALGAQLLLRLSAKDQVHPLLPVVAYQHHMGADRSGYPRIPVCAKPHAASLLVAVADVFDALRTVRPYRGAWSTERACTILLEDGAAGKLHEPYVSVLLGLLKVLSPGRRVGLSDGRDAVVLETGVADPLQPKVGTGDGVVLDLEDPAAPYLVAVSE